jgi:hypothetical protein
MILHACCPTAFTGPPTTGTSPTAVCKRLKRSLHLERALALEIPFVNFATLSWDIGRTRDKDAVARN